MVRDKPSKRKAQPGNPQLTEVRGLGARLIAVGAAMIVLQVTPVPQVVRDSGILARALVLNHEHRRAVEQVERVLAYLPWSSDDLELQAREELGIEDNVSALNSLERLASLRALRGDELLTLAAIYLQRGQPDLATQVLRDAASRGQIQEPVFRQEATRAFHDRSWWTADAALEGLMAIRPDDTETLARLGLVQALDQPERAVVTLAAAAARDPNIAGRMGDLQKHLAERGTLAPDKAYAQLGIIYAGMAEYELADTALTRTVDLNPAYGEPLAYLAFVRAKLGEPALGAMQQAIALSPTSPTTHYLAGLTWKSLGRPIDARAEFEQAYDLDPKNPSTAVEIANTHRSESADVYAEIWMQEAVRLSGGDLRFRILLAQFYVDDNYKVAEAGLPLAQQLVVEAPNNAETHDALGWAYYLLGGLDRAAEQLNRALEIDPSLARAHTHLGALLEAQGNPGGAIEQYQQAAKLDPDGAFGALARRALERLKP